MATLVIKSPGFGDRVILLKLGLNRFGRGPDNDFTIEDPTISVHHCDIVLGSSVVVRDVNSTNGTYVAERPVREATLLPGQMLRLGDVELLVESTDLQVSIPKIEVALPAPPIVEADGTMRCSTHKGQKITHQCTHCRQVLCEQCLRRIRRKGGKLNILCPVCGYKCEPIEKPTRKKRNLWSDLAKTVKMAFLREK